MSQKGSTQDLLPRNMCAHRAKEHAPVILGCRMQSKGLGCRWDCGNNARFEIVAFDLSFDWVPDNWPSEETAGISIVLSRCSLEAHLMPRPFELVQVGAQSCLAQTESLHPIRPGRRKMIECATYIVAPIPSAKS